MDDTGHIQRDQRREWWSSRCSSCNGSCRCGSHSSGKRLAKASARSRSRWTIAANSAGDSPPSDVVTATITVAVAARIRKAGDPEPKEAKETSEVFKEKIGGKAYTESTVTVSIEEIDRTAPSVTVKAPDGRILSFRVKNAANLKNLKVGDQVDVTVGLGLLLSVEPAPGD